MMFCNDVEVPKMLIEVQLVNRDSIVGVDDIESNNCKCEERSNGAIEKSLYEINLCSSKFPMNL